MSIEEREARRGWGATKSEAVAFDVVGPQPDPERPPVIVIQELDHPHEETVRDQSYGRHSVEDAFDVPPAPAPPFIDPPSDAECHARAKKGYVPTYDGRGSWTGWEPGLLCPCLECESERLSAERAEEHDRSAALAREALARMDAHLPPGAAERKAIPVATGFMDYFPDAIAAVARLSKIGNDQHNPGTPLHWDRSKSTDEADTLMRHFLDRGTFDNDGVRHSVKVAWRAMALLQKEIEAAKGLLEPIFKEAQ